VIDGFPIVYKWDDCVPRFLPPKEDGCKQGRTPQRGMSKLELSNLLKPTRCEAARKLSDRLYGRGSLNPPPPSRLVPPPLSASAAYQTGPATFSCLKKPPPPLRAGPTSSDLYHRAGLFEEHEFSSGEGEDLEPPSAGEDSSSSCDGSDMPAEPEPSSGGSAGAGLRPGSDPEADSRAESESEPELATGAHAGRLPDE